VKIVRTGQQQVKTVCVEGTFLEEKKLPLVFQENKKNVNKVQCINVIYTRFLLLCCVCVASMCVWSD